MSKQLCGCDDSKKWKARAFSSDLALKLVRQQLARLLERVDAALRVPGELMDSEFAEVDEPADEPRLSREEIERELRRLAESGPPKTTAEYALESARMDPNAWRRLVLRMAELIPARSKSERP